MQVSKAACFNFHLIFTRHHLFLLFELLTNGSIRVGKYMFDVKNENTVSRCELNLLKIIKKGTRLISENINTVSSMPTLNMSHQAFNRNVEITRSLY